MSLDEGDLRAHPAKKTPFWANFPYVRAEESATVNRIFFGAKWGHFDLCHRQLLTSGQIFFCEGRYYSVKTVTCRFDFISRSGVAVMNAPDIRKVPLDAR